MTELQDVTEQDAPWNQADIEDGGVGDVEIDSLPGDDEPITTSGRHESGIYFSATYDPADDKLRISASSRLPAELYARVKAVGYGWAPKQEVFYAVWSPRREDLAIELAGEIGDEDTSLVDRAEQRAERFEGYQDNRAADANRARKAVDAIAGGIPMGQPILIGHHSEKHARRDAAKIENGMRKAVQMWETAEYWKYRAAGALAHAKYKESPVVRARRIKTIEAEMRSLIASYTPHANQPAMIQDRSYYNGFRYQCNVCAEPHFQVGYRHEMTCTACGGKDWTEAPERVPHVVVGPKGRGCMWVAADRLESIKTRNQRSIAHCEMRLIYERAMLEEAGASSLLEKKKRPSLLPICNYKQPEGFQIENRWNRGQMIHYAQVEMTQAEYAKIYTDYKGTQIIGNSHRVRSAVIRHAHVCVFLTDSKVHPIPEAVERVPVERPIPTPTYSARAVDPEAEKFDALKQALKTGVHVVSAPQLFPTPKELALKMIYTAGLHKYPAMRILEPSVGTGAILSQLEAWDTAEIVAVEINHNLAAAIRRNPKFSKVAVFEGDFLEQNGNLGTFDVVLMNPPFANAADIKHIQHARNFLKPGGVLVAICANGPRQREALMDECEHWEDLPTGTFMESGTGVNTALLVIRG